MIYTYTIHDAHPGQSGPCSWPTHDGLELEADDMAEALSDLREILEGEAGGLNPADGYEIGDCIYAQLGTPDGDTRVVSYELTAEDLGIDVSKSGVTSWNTEACYVATFPSDDGEGACDVEVQIGEAGGRWYLRTTDDGGGSDECDDTSYATEEAAAAAAEEFATDSNEADEGENAEDYLLRRLEEAAGEPEPEGEWCVYWETALDDAGPRERYATQEQADAAAQLANESLHAANPGGDLLCGFEVRQLVDGEWAQVQS